MNYGDDNRRIHLTCTLLACRAPAEPGHSLRESRANTWIPSALVHGGKEYRRLIASFERIFGSTILFGTDTHTERTKMIRRHRFNFLSKAQLWYTRTPEQRCLPGGFPVRAAAPQPRAF
jgi:hypothetical protein